MRLLAGTRIGCWGNGPEVIPAPRPRLTHRDLRQAGRGEQRPTHRHGIGDGSCATVAELQF